MQAEDGEITLTGQLGRHDRPQAVVRDVHGRAGIIDEFTIKPAGEAGDMEADIDWAALGTTVAETDIRIVQLQWRTIGNTTQVNTPTGRRTAHRRRIEQ